MCIRDSLSSVITNSASLSYNGKVQSVSDVYGNVFVSSSFGASGTWTQRYVNTTNTNFTVMPAKVAMSLDGKFQVATVFKNQITSRFAGNGIPGFSGDGADAASAQLSYQPDVKFDASNNAIIGDGYNQRVRRICLLYTSPSPRDS